MPIYYKTPYSRLYWSTLEEWLKAAYVIRARRSSFRKNQQRESHVAALPEKLIYACHCRESLDSALELMTAFGSDFLQPCRGNRAQAPHTPLIVALNNRIAHIDRMKDLSTIPDGHNSRQLAAPD